MPRQDVCERMWGKEGGGLKVGAVALSWGENWQPSLSVTRPNSRNLGNYVTICRELVFHNGVDHGRPRCGIGLLFQNPDYGLGGKIPWRGT